MVRFTLTNMLKFCSDYHIGQLSIFLLLPYPRQALSLFSLTAEYVGVKPDADFACGLNVAQKVPAVVSVKVSRVHLTVLTPPVTIYRLDTVSSNTVSLITRLRRMHSSRMRIARSLPYGGVCVRGVSLTENPPGTRPHGQRHPCGQRPTP